MFIYYKEKRLVGKMLNDKQKAIIRVCRSADRNVNQSLLKGDAFLLCLMFVSASPPFTEFLVLKKAGRETFITHIVKPGLVIRKSGVQNEK